VLTVWGSRYRTRLELLSTLMPLPVMNVVWPTRSPTVSPKISGSYSSPRPVVTLELRLEAADLRPLRVRGSCTRRRAPVVPGRRLEVLRRGVARLAARTLGHVRGRHRRGEPGGEGRRGRERCVVRDLEFVGLGGGRLVRRALFTVSVGRLLSSCAPSAGESAVGLVSVGDVEGVLDEGLEGLLSLPHAQMPASTAASTANFNAFMRFQPPEATAEERPADETAAPARRCARRRLSDPVIFHTYRFSAKQSAAGWSPQASACVSPERTVSTEVRSGSAGEHRAEHEPDVRGALGEAAHVPREPVGAVRR